MLTTASRTSCGNASLASELSIDKDEVAMVMMKAGMFYPVGGQSQADQLKALIDSLKG